MTFQLNAYHKLPLKIIITVAMLLVLVGCDQATKSASRVATLDLTSSCRLPVPANTPVGYWPMDTNNFQGVFQFLGQTNPKNAANPNISGANLEWSWAKIEPLEGQFDWSVVDRDINAWTSVHKSVILRFATGGQKVLSGSVNGSYTPSWLFDTYKVPRITEINGTVFPVYWNAIYLQKLANFVKAASSGKPGDFAQFFDGSTGTAFATRTPITDTGTWSMEASLYPTMLPQTEAIAVMNGADGSSGAGGFGFGIAAGADGGRGSNLVAYFPGVGWIDSGYTFSSARQWYHIIVTRDGNVVKFYVNGQQTPNTSTLLPNTVPAHISIGSGYNFTAGTATQFFTGAIEKVSTYISTLNEAQVKSHQ